VRTFEGRPNTAEGYASLGAGARVRSRPIGGLAQGGSTPLEGGTAAEASARRTGRPASGEVVVLGGPATIALNSGKHLPSEPGALGEALHRAGLKTAVVGNADNVGSLDPRSPRLFRPAAIALMDRAASVDHGAVDRAGLLVADPSAPFGHRAAEDQVVSEATRAIAAADVVIVDPGDLERATEYRRLALARAADRQWADALRRTDSLLGAVADRLPPRTLLLVVAPSPPADGWHLTPTVAAGPGVPRGELHSPSTKRLGVVTITDLAPTILAALGVEPPHGMIGHPLRYHPGEADLGRLRTIDEEASFRESVAYPITLTFIIVQAAVYLLVMLLFGRRGGTGRARGAIHVIVLLIAAFPLASFLLRAVPGAHRLGPGAIALLLLIDGVVVALVMRSRRHPLSPLTWILALTAGLILADVATGVRLQTSSLLGYSLHIAARFYGLGNAAFAVVAACSILAVAAHVHYAPRRREAVATGAAVLAAVVIVDGAPSLGDDVGGILTLVPVFGATWLAISGRRLSWRVVAAVGLAALVVLAAATAVDVARPAEDRTHLGRLVADVEEGGADVFTTTVTRKLSTNLRVLGTSVWTWLVPVIAVFALYLLLYENRWRALLPPGSALRAGAVGTLAAGILGFAANDSGVVVTALVFVYLGPFLAVLALHEEAREEVLLEPAPAPARDVAPISAR
jgi:hypothetical protein